MQTDQIKSLALYKHNYNASKKAKADVGASAITGSKKSLPRKLYPKAGKLSLSTGKNSDPLLMPPAPKQKAPWDLPSLVHSVPVSIGTVLAAESDLLEAIAPYEYGLLPQMHILATKDLLRLISVMVAEGLSTAS